MKIKNKVKKEYDIAVMLATRGRTDSLYRSLLSLINRARHLDRIEFFLAFDNDDDKGWTHWETVIKHELDKRDVNYTVLKFDRLGYANLHMYFHAIMPHTDSDWLMIWNDDAIMETQNWDRVIAKHCGEFKLLAFRTHHDHPYSIFPVFPREWYEVLGHASQHHLSDAWLSQIAYILDLFERIEVWVTHDRHDLTGNNYDETYKGRVVLEGQPDRPGDFHYRDITQMRHLDASRLAAWLHDQGNDMTFFNNVKSGKQDPWEKLRLNDVNKQMRQWGVSYLET